MNEIQNETLIIETPARGFNEVTAFPLLFGGLFACLGVLMVVVAPGRGWLHWPSDSPRCSSVSRWPASVFASPANTIGLS